ncbi:hypothetical protein B0H13DRAFT_671704 [Mycena leptocephala]|nr:hypothetical protein B0H13DRAFT_671704 [Mycena leptocephala]
MQTKFVSLRIVLSALAVSQFVGAAPGPTVDCSGVRCASVQCAPHQIAEVPAGACCPVCFPCPFNVVCPACGTCSVGRVEPGHCCPTCGLPTSTISI